MRIDFGTLAFGFKVLSGGGNPNWATSLGQGKDYKINDNPEIDDIIKGILHSSISLSNVKTKIGKGGKFIQGDEEGSPIIMAGVFSKVYINDIKIENQKYILLITRDTSKSHMGRLRLKYGPSNTYEDIENGISFSNDDFICEARKQLDMEEKACWFVYDIKVKNQDELILSAIIVDKEKEKEYRNNSELHEAWDSLIPDSIQDNSEFYEAEESLIPESTKYNDIVCKKLGYNIQNLYFGAPGTGKSYGVDEIIKDCYPDIEIKDNPFVFKTTIYSDYSYYNFIGNIMPTSKNGEIRYDFKAGVFSQALARAFEYKDKEIFLIVEEMSRGNIASIFGDVFQLLDRDEDGNSEYFINNDLISKHLKDKEINIGNKIYLPRNFHIIGTVNTSDQNVNVIDTAFKRRFEFIYVDVSPVYNKEDGTLKNTYKFELGDQEFEWNNLYMALNELIKTKMELSEDKQIGQFFIKFNNYHDDQQKFNAIQNKLLHYLWDDVQGASISDEYSIFDKSYKTFSSLYKDFGDKKNVFSEELITLYAKQSF